MGRIGRQCLLAAVLGWLCLDTEPGYGAGFSLYEASARSNSLASAVIARADDLSAIFYNPAGLVQLPGFQIMGGFSTFIPRVEVVTNPGPVETRTLMESTVSFGPHFFTSYQITERVWLGLGLNSPFGLGVRYESNWPGRFNLMKGTIDTLNLNPTLAVKITDNLSLGAGLDIMYF